MKTQVQEAKSTICFQVQFAKPQGSEPWINLPLPREASASISTRDEVMAEGTLDGFPFRALLQATEQGIHELRLNEATRQAAGAHKSDSARVELTRFGDEPETRLPLELLGALAASPPAQAVWTDVTALGRRDWILWITTAKQAKTRLSRIEKAIDMLSSGKRRVCCFGGLNWLTKDHPIETWVPLPKDSAN